MVTKLQEAQLGTDIYEESDFKVSSSGDLAIVSGVSALLYRIDRMLITNPGEIFHRPTWGVGIISFLNQPNNANTVARLRNAILRNVSKDPDVLKVTGVNIRRQETGAIIKVSLIARGGVPISQDFGFEVNG